MEGEHPTLDQSFWSTGSMRMSSLQATIPTSQNVSPSMTLCTATTASSFQNGAGKRIRRRRKTISISSLHVLLLLYICSFIGSDGGCQSGSAPCEKNFFAAPPLIPPVCALRTGGARRDDSKEGEVSAVSPMENLSLNQILVRAGKRSLGGGIPGAFAGVIQVLMLMWLRTITNYQSRYGTTFKQALNTLLREGGISRLYRGLSFALIQAPIIRFVSTAANDGVESLVSSFESSRHWGPGRTTVVASIIVGVARIVLMPIDTMKTVLQVDSAEGFRNLVRRVKAGKFNVLYQGSTATAVGAIFAHYPWFFTYNYLSAKEWVENLIPSRLLRNASIGFLASIVSDTVSNAFKVIKTTKQALGSKHNSSYSEVVRMIVAADGLKGLFGRGLLTRIGTNALQSILFTVIWRGLSERVQEKTSAKREDTETS